MSESAERITQINNNDVICGRSSVALKHPGNIAYRKIISLNKELYATCPKTDKLRISRSIVSAMQEAGCRFLEREYRGTKAKGEAGSAEVWNDIGTRRAVDKTSQALREGQPKLLNKLAYKQQLKAMSHHYQVHQYHAAAMNPMVGTNYQYSPPLPAQAATPHTASQAATPITISQAVAPIRTSQAVAPPPTSQAVPPRTASQAVAPPATSSLLHILSQLDTPDLLLLAYQGLNKR
ncbi:hypothetical protein ACHAXR_003812 [Thalassiosira sp. AJA248-18]